MAKTTEVTMDRQEFNHDLNDIQFASHKDLYRAKIGSTSEGTRFWLENKKDKSQWQSTVKDVSTAGSGGVLPEEVIIESVKVIVQPCNRTTEYNPVYFGLCLLNREHSSR
jgi:hypothetical protein